VSRFLVTCWPFTGHLLPQMSIALALRERGHDVAFYSGEAARTLVEGEGFELFAFERLDQERAFRAMRAVDTGPRRRRPGGGRLLPILRDWLVETIPDQLADIAAVLEGWRPDALATDLSLWGPILVLNDREPVPVALSSTFMGPLIPGPDAPAFGFGLTAPRTRRARWASGAITRMTELMATPLRRRIDEIRAANGLSELGESVNRYTARLPLYLVGNIRELDYDRRDLPPSVHYVGNCVWYPPVSPGDQEWLAAIPTDRPWVHVTESTLAYGDPFLLRLAIEGLAEQPMEVIVTTGVQREPSALQLGALPANVHVARWLNHGDFLPRCAAVVTVGGKATVLAALEAGVPLVIVPTSWDKPDNARRVTHVGAGLQLSARRCTPATLRAAVTQLLTEPRYGAAARAIATRLAAAPGPAGAAALLERLATAGAATAPVLGGAPWQS
jgi:MGT family glycosyltransferase